MEHAEAVLGYRIDDETMKLDHKLRLLEIFASEQKFHLEHQQKRLQFFITILSTILAATVAGAMQARGPEQFLLLLAGPLLIFLLTFVGKQATSSAYRAFLEAVTSRAKVEDELGMTKQPADPTSRGFWHEEPIVYGRHLQDRRAACSSTEFVKDRVGVGYQAITGKVFTAFRVVSCVISVAIIILAAASFFEKDMAAQLAAKALLETAE